jgi:glycosyltransferase involved in cell wall biosynthesis
LGIAPDAVVLLALANPRPQKRLHALPGIIAALQARDPQQRAVHLIVAGEASAQSEAAQRALAELQAELARYQLAEHAHLVGLVTDTAGLLAESDVLVSPSEHEGLSLAHLEALAAGVPVVATGDGGTRELAAECPRLRHLPVTSSADTFAQEILELAATQDSVSAAVIDRHYSASRMAAQYARLYEPALARNAPRRKRSGILLVTNNFSLGGAQSSARRLLLGLKAAGVSVRAVTIEEQPEYPTLGRAALRDAGVEVLALPPPHDWEPERAVRLLLEAIEEQPPEAVVLWNVIAVHKLLIADGLLDTPLFDVSPGEMYFASLQRYFATSRQPGLPYRDARAYGARLSGIVVKYAAEAAIAGQLLGCPVHVIPNGVDASATPRARNSQAPLSIGTAVRIHPDKRLDELLSAVRLAAPALPPFVLRIAGGADRGADAYAAELRHKSADLPIEWLGELSDSRAFLDMLDVFALVAEPAGCPNASLEAMARGLPVVATDVGGMREQIEPNVTGKLVGRADANAFAAALVDLGKDAPLRQRLGNAALERTRQLFSLERMVTAYREVCIDQRPSAPPMLSTRPHTSSSDWCTPG